MNTIKFVNCTKDEVRLNDGRVFPPSKNPARIVAVCTDFDSDGIANIKYKEAYLPMAEHGTIYIVPYMVKLAEPQRKDFVCPLYTSPDAVYVNGRCVSVPGFMR